MKLIKPVLKASVRAILIAAITLGLVAFSPIWVPWVAIVTLRRRVALRRFLKRHSGEIFFIWRSRHNWHDFICNNVLPALPADVKPLHDERPRPPVARMILRARADWQSQKRAGPLLVFVKQRAVRILSLNKSLRPFKDRAGRVPQVRDAVARVIRDARRAGLAAT